MSAREVVAEFIAHAVGHKSPGMVDQADELIDALAAAGFAVTELPKPDHRLIIPELDWLTFGDVEATYVSVSVGSGKVRCYLLDDDPRMMADEAREITAALLAAAEHAHTEGGQR